VANSAQALIARVFREGRQIRTANVIPFNVPPIIGLSTAGGFEYELEGLEGQAPAAMNSVMLRKRQQQCAVEPRLLDLHGQQPSIYLDVDREKAQAPGLSMNDVFGALQATLEGVHINNFNLFGRIRQVNIQTEAADRNDISSLWQIYVNKYNVPLRLIADTRVVVGPPWHPTHCPRPGKGALCPDTSAHRGNINAEEAMVCAKRHKLRSPACRHCLVFPPRPSSRPWTFRRGPRSEYSRAGARCN
jgi:AcrB/AcrD/AcrF family